MIYGFIVSFRKINKGRIMGRMVLSGLRTNCKTKRRKRI